MFLISNLIWIELPTKHELHGELQMGNFRVPHSFTLQLHRDALFTTECDCSAYKVQSFLSGEASKLHSTILLLKLACSLNITENYFCLALLLIQNGYTVLCLVLHFFFRCLLDRSSCIIVLAWFLLQLSLSHICQIQSTSFQMSFLSIKLPKDFAIISFPINPLTYFQSFSVPYKLLLAWLSKCKPNKTKD